MKRPRFFPSPAFCKRWTSPPYSLAFFAVVIGGAALNLAYVAGGLGGAALNPRFGPLIANGWVPVWAFYGLIQMARGWDMLQEQAAEIEQTIRVRDQFLAHARQVMSDNGFPLDEDEFARVSKANLH